MEVWRKVSHGHWLTIRFAVLDRELLLRSIQLSQVVNAQVRLAPGGKTDRPVRPSTGVRECGGHEGYTKACDKDSAHFKVPPN